jgi:biotin synthase
MNWTEVADRALCDQSMTREEGLAAVNSADDDLLALLDAAYRVRAHHHGRKVRINVLNNAKSGACAEDCTFCSQSARAGTDIPKYPMRSADELLDGANRAVAMGAVTYCMVTSMTRPSATDIETICEAAGRIKERWPLKVCTSLGILDREQADTLAAAGVDRYNHNLETSERHFPNICSTHRWQDRVDTIHAVHAAGLEACCGGIIGLGEDAEDRVDLALTLRELGVISIPLNFLDPRPGTPLADRPRPTPTDCLRALALFRLANPQAQDLRVAGGREACLGAMQPLAFFAANSLFSNGYLTTPGQGASHDLKMIQDAGFEAAVLGD